MDPDEETLAKMQEKRAKDLEQKELLNQLKGKENGQRADRKSTFMRTLVTYLILVQYLRMMQAE